MRVTFDATGAACVEGDSGTWRVEAGTVLLEHGLDAEARRHGWTPEGATRGEFLQGLTRYRRTGQPRRTEAEVIVRGRLLTCDEVGTVRTALTAFVKDLELAMRRQSHGREAEQWLGRIKNIVRELEEAKVG